MCLSKLIALFKSTNARLWHSRRAATAVEFALVAPVFLMMTIGVLEMGRAMFIKSAIQFTVEATARYAAVNEPADLADATIMSAYITSLEVYAADEYTNSGAGLTGATFVVTREDANNRTYMSITGSYDFSVFVPLISIPDITLQSKSRMPVG